MIELDRNADMAHGTYLIHEAAVPEPLGSAHKAALIMSLTRKTVGQPVKLTNGSEVGQVVGQLTTPAPMQVGKRLVKPGSLLLGIKWADPAMLSVAKDANLSVDPDGVTLYGDGDIKKAAPRLTEDEVWAQLEAHAERLGDLVSQQLARLS